MKKRSKEMDKFAPLQEFLDEDKNNKLMMSSQMLDALKKHGIKVSEFRIITNDNMPKSTISTVSLDKFKV